MNEVTLQMQMMTQRKISDSEEQELQEILDTLPESLVKENQLSDMGKMPIRPFYRYLHLKTNDICFKMRGMLMNLPDGDIKILHIDTIVEIEKSYYDNVGKLLENFRAEDGPFDKVPDELVECLFMDSDSMPQTPNAEPTDPAKF